MSAPVRLNVRQLSALDSILFLPAKKPRGNPRNKQHVTYMDAICAFDIETTTYQDLNWMYIWQFQLDEKATVTGRTWDEFRIMIDWLRSRSEGCRWLIYCHNLSYEWQYIRGIYPFSPDEVFATDARKVLKCVMYDCLEFRCSQFLSNMSLANFTRTMMVDHQKQSGEVFDYSKIRYPWTELSEYEMKYATYDVIGLVEAVKALMKANNDTIYTVPLTSTGYPRRDIKYVMRKYSWHRLRDMQPSMEVFLMLRDAFRGGNTHASRFWAGKTAENVLSFDRSSSYPDVMVNRLYPMGKWEAVQDPTPEKVLALIAKPVPVLFEVGLYNIRLKEETWPVPYIPVDKCRHLENHVNDNGRVLEADYLEITLTDVDFRILLEEYDYDDMVIGRCYRNKYGRLPAQYYSMVNRYYKLKTTLKGVTGREREYNLNKAKLNSLYGMAAQVPVKPTIKYMDGEWVPDDTPAEELLEKHNRTAWSSYAWGCWVTAWARYELEKGIRKAEEKHGCFIYCDTDSIKYINMGQDWSEMNQEYRDISDRHDATALDPAGVRHWMGVYEEDGCYRKFRTLGAKRYAYVDQQDKLHITVSGVAKYGARELEEAGGLDAFKEGMTWHRSGKTEATYVDDPGIRSVTMEGREIEITPYVLIRDVDYTLTMSDDYLLLISLQNSRFVNAIIDSNRLL